MLIQIIYSAHNKLHAITGRKHGEREVKVDTRLQKAARPESATGARESC